MAQLIVTVDRLNKRNAVPSNFADKSSIIGVVTRGFRFEGVEVPGIANAAVGKWYRDRDGSFYWGGGLMELGAGIPGAVPTAGPAAVVPGGAGAAAGPIAPEGGEAVGAGGGTPGEPILPDGTPDYINISFLPDKMSWAHDRLQVPTIWKDTKTAGKDVVVAIIDSGIDVMHEDLKDAILSRSISIDSNGVVDEKTPLADRLKDNKGHGTKMAGIIAAKGKNLVYGIAPQCKILVVKILEPANGVQIAALSKAFEWLSKQTDVDIITASLTTDEITDDLKKNMQANLDKGTAIFGAIGDFHSGTTLDDDLFPACYEGCTAIGAFDPSGVLCNFSDWNAHLSLLAPGDDHVFTTGVGNKKDEGGETSIACAITAASFALLISYLKQKQGNAYSGKATDHLSKLFDAAEDMGSTLKKDPMHGFGRLNLRNAIANFNNQNHIA